MIGSDTIDAGFSEPLKNPPIHNFPFNFTNQASEQSAIPTHYYGRNQKLYRFVVDSPTRYSELKKVDYSVPPDSAWINSDLDPALMIVDSLLNRQDNLSSQRVPMEFRLRPDQIVDTTTTAIDEQPIRTCGCGSGTGLALIPPIFYYSRRRLCKGAKR